MGSSVPEPALHWQGAHQRPGGCRSTATPLLRSVATAESCSSGIQIRSKHGSRDIPGAVGGSARATVVGDGEIPISKCKPGRLGWVSGTFAPITPSLPTPGAQRGSHRAKGDGTKPWGFSSTTPRCPSSLLLCSQVGAFPPELC